jgi:hypothetical protein
MIAGAAEPSVDSSGGKGPGGRRMKTTLCRRPSKEYPAACRDNFVVNERFIRFYVDAA